MTHSTVAAGLKGLTRDGNSVVDAIVCVSPPDGINVRVRATGQKGDAQYALEFCTRTRDDEEV